MIKTFLPETGLYFPLKGLVSTFFWIRPFMVMLNFISPGIDDTESLNLDIESYLYLIINDL